jgi:predicted transcriptional regulator
MIRPKNAVLLSLRPEFGQAILSGEKTIELRRRVLRNVGAGTLVVMYEAAPTMAVRGFAIVKNVETRSPGELWPSIWRHARVTQSQYRKYFAGAATAVAIHLEKATSLEKPLTLRRLRTVSSTFMPPQSFQYLSSLPVRVRSLIHRAVARQ